MSEIQSSRFLHSEQISEHLGSVIDFIRFAMTEFNHHDVYYGHGTANAWQEAQNLVFSALALPLDTSSEERSIFFNCQLTTDEKRLIMAWIQIRAEEGVPLPYLTHQAWFAGMPFYVDERVLIPRSPFAELIKHRFEPFLSAASQPIHILDMCTGGGCIAIALANEFEEAQVDAVDIDADALEVASININEYQLEDRVFPIQSDLFKNLAKQQYDLIVINPPYVDNDDMQDLPREYHHEPEHALASGQDGLDLTHQILMQAAEHMNDNAWLFVEVGNSEVNFVERFGKFEVQWCELNEGGSGIFAISKEQLLAQMTNIKL